MNEHKPWEENQMSELDYWKMRYIEAQKEIAILEKKLLLQTPYNCTCTGSISINGSSFTTCYECSRRRQ